MAIELLTVVLPALFLEQISEVASTTVFSFINNGKSEAPGCKDFHWRKADGDGRQILVKKLRH